MKQTLSIMLLGFSLFCGCSRLQVVPAPTIADDKVPYITNTGSNTVQNLYTDEEAENFHTGIKPDRSYKSVEDLFNDLNIDQKRTRLIGYSTFSFELRVYVLSPSYRLSVVNPCGMASFSAKISKDEKPRRATIEQAPGGDSLKAAPEK